MAKTGSGQSLKARRESRRVRPTREPAGRAELTREIDEKMARVEQFLKARNLVGVLITQVRNFSWITAGIADNHILITSELGAASLLVMRGGKKYVLASNSEMARLTEEDLSGLGYEAKEFKWYDDRREQFIKDIARGGEVATDAPFTNLRVIDGEIASLRYELTASEIKKYRWLGRNTAEAVEAVCVNLRPGMREREIEAMTSNELMTRGIRPTVLLIGTDDRVYNFRHAPPSGAKLRRYGMVNVCARRWGLVAAVTRFAHFGPLPRPLKQRLQAAARVNAEYQAHSTPGAKAGEILERAMKAYAEQGFEGEWENHHQGGAIGYGERDWIALPGSSDLVHERQGLAWNPTIQGAKVEDTIIAHRDHVENITRTPGWPTVDVEVKGATYKSPDILIMNK